MLTPRLEAQLEAIGRASHRVRGDHATAPVLADIGSDHGLVTVEALRRGLVSRVIASDVAAGPLARTRRAVEQAGLAQHVDLRLGDGLDVVGPGEASLVLIGGLGGLQTITILQKGHSTVAAGSSVVILQPMTHVGELRHYLLSAGYGLVEEYIIHERHHYYQLVVVSRIVGVAQGNHVGARGPADLDNAILRQFGFDPRLRDLSLPEPGDDRPGPDLLTRLVLELGPLDLLERNPVAYRYARDRLRRARRAVRQFDRGGGHNQDRRRELVQRAAYWEELAHRLDTGRKGSNNDRHGRTDK